MGSEAQITFGLDGSLADRIAPTSPAAAPPRMAAVENVSTGREIGVPRKAPRAQRRGVPQPGARKCGAIVRSNVLRPSTVYMGAPAAGHTEIEANGTAPIAVRSSLVAGSRAQNAYFPVDVVDSGSMQAPGVVGSAVCDDLKAVLIFDEASGSMSLALSHKNGPLEVVQLLGAAPNDLFGLAITRHGTATKYRLWYSRANEIRCRALTIAAGSLTVGPENSIYAPFDGSLARFVATSFGIDGSGDGQYAWVLTQDSAVSSTVRLLKVDVDAFSVPLTRAFAGELVSGIGYVFAAAHLRIGTTDYVSLAWQDPGGAGGRCAVVNGTTMAVSIAAATFDAGVPGQVATQWLAIDTWVGMVFASSDIIGVVGTSEMRTLFSFRRGPTMASPGTADDAVTLRWTRLHSHGCQWSRSNTEVIPFFAVQAAYATNVAPTANEFLEDPSIELYTPQLYDVANAEFTLSSVARVGVDRACALSVFYSTYCPWIGCTTAGRLTVMYGADPVDNYRESPASIRYATIDLTSGGRAVQVEGGLAFIAAAQPAYWDGIESAEYGPLHKPKVFALATGGSGSNLTGTYAYRAVVTWRDARGDLHRSAPSLPFTITPAGTPPQVWVTTPTTCRDGVTQRSYDIELYASKNGGVFYLLTDSIPPLTALLPTSKAAVGCWLFGSITEPGSAGARLLYSTGAAGQEILPTAPPPLYDVAVVQNRLWAIDAEDRTRALATKQKRRGIAYEFGDGLEVRLPAGARMHAVTEIDGVPILLTERGAYSISGDGPNNTGYGAWSPPLRLAEPPCTQRNSVVRTPAGVLYANDHRFVLLTGGGARVFDELVAPTNIIAAELYEATNEVVFWRSEGSAYVYNYAQDKWATWSELFGDVTAALVRGTFAVAFDDTAGTGTYYFVDQSRAHATAQARWETHWLQPAGPQGASTIREVLLLVRRDGVHGLQVTAYTDYQTDAVHTTQITMTADEVTAAAQSGYYTVRCALKSPTARSVKVIVQETDATGDGCVPVACTILANVDPGIQRRYLAAGNK